MKTVIYQSYRTENVPSWITQCMKTVKDWSQANNFDYQFIDDRLFEYVPEWYRKKVNNQIHLTSDLARLNLAKEYLSKGYDRAIWIDADILIFNQEKFNLPIDQPYLFCREIWLDYDRIGQKVTCQTRVNNSVSVFLKNNSLLDFYIHACEEIVKNKSQIVNISVGTVFLTLLYQAIGGELINNVGLFSPFITNDIAQCQGIFSSIYMKAFAHPIYAANLCTSFREMNYYGIIVSDAVYEQAINNLLQTQGMVVNQYCPEITNIEQKLTIREEDYRTMVVSIEENSQPLDREANLALAIRLHKANFLTEAEQIYQNILKNYPDDPEALYWLGVLSNQLSRQEQAEQLFRKSLKIQPNLAKAWFSLGNLYQGQGKLQEGIGYYQKALDLQPDSAFIHNNLGYALQQQGQWEKAIACYQKALELQPNCVEAKVNLDNALKTQVI
ncbi:TPR repeat-containing protein [Rippkaea orientalis PCC 8801]|uniref:TPR repeat-containing protein n=1 Tax=Rippkaea orientalis (strain PCC 8801 / RF-1) TaxID=41431 RepID=B7JYD9_RIPO1|nr:tetratricopeptide repeat protein [Rippkaea orientalis]ACK67241.1 TPR repeat-containing protein [Rippkaea orientalis PCC 8801]